jgi:hypothetical protein
MDTIIAASQDITTVDYHITYHWDTSNPLTILHARVSGSLLADPAAIAALIDQTHTLVDERPGAAEVTIVYDLTHTEGRLPLAALMRRSVISPAVRRVIVCGARSRTDEMAVLIMSAAKRLPYDILFAASAPGREPQFFAHQR